MPIFILSPHPSRVIGVAPRTILLEVAFVLFGRKENIFTLSLRGLHMWLICRGTAG